MDQSALLETLKTLCGLPNEAATVEFKSNLVQPEEIGQYLSALANAAALEGHNLAWLVWGIEDGSHAVAPIWKLGPRAGFATEHASSKD